MSAIAQRDENNVPDHLLVLVHGIWASPSVWLYVEAEMKRRVGTRFLIYASSSNTSTKTFGGIDGAGKRLAEEVRQVVQKSKSLKKISFLAHSLGGLFARHAVAVLYSQANDDAVSKSGDSHILRGRIAGLEPINFITLATPHLGVRGRKQLPFLLGVPILEKLAAPIAPFFIGRTGTQLFLTDGKADKPPLLLRMASDCEDLKFLSSLGAFPCRIVYANVSYDYMVGWRTSSIRRETELFKGSVYCDTCRVQFMTRLSKVLEGAKVKLECKGRENQTVTLTKEAMTDKDGNYEMEVMGDHEEEVCEIILVQSPDAECGDVNNQEFLRNAARISLTANDGIVSNETRTINPLGFMRKTPLADCPQAFKELGIVPDVTF
ncbi:hypothetical protein F2Q68_00035035 [Brassica cretica]|uniref:DUF676 domain-containing protein n=1 Tax=Brassica cretica TaxID=69181 RepID=A0A8S9H0P6_BRACR|nr:hypothetical protein F2Q68_00035035 [Brassica cretica]